MPPPIRRARGSETPPLVDAAVDRSFGSAHLLFGGAMMRLEPDSTTVLVIDVQEKLAKAMPDSAMASLLRAASVLIDSAMRLGVRVVATEQYPAGLGPTLPVLREKLIAAKAPILEKLDFAATGAPSFLAAFGAPRSVVAVGMETHVCV